MLPLRAHFRPFALLSSAVSLSLALVLGHAPGAAAQGLVFESDEAYGQYPKLERHRAFLPERVDLSARFPTPGDQGEQGSCVGWAVGYAARSYYAVAREGQPRNSAGAIPSPAYIYGAIKLPGGCEVGALITRALDLLTREGAVSLASFPYRDRQCPVPNRIQSRQFTIRNWRALTIGQIDDAKGALARGHPVMIGAKITREFMRLPAGTVWRGEGNLLPGGHAMTLVGYDERRQAFRVINSWGKKWSEGGFGWIGYEAYRRYVIQAYVMDVAAAPAPPPFTPAPPKRISSFDPGQRILGGFVARSDATGEAPSAQACQARCLDEPRCQGWHWWHADEATSPKTCSLFASVRSRTRNEYATSGLVTLAPAPPPAPRPSPAPSPPPAPVVTLDPPLASYQCASLAVAGNSVRGFVGSDADLAKLKDSARRAGVGVDVAVRPWPQCEVLLTFKEAFAEPSAPRLRLRGDRREFKKGDPLVIEVATPPTPSYLYLIYIPANGAVVYLEQPTGPAMNPQPPSRTIVLGDGSNKGSRFFIDAPYGNEMIIAVAAASPLFDQLRHPEVEREFLTAFRKALLVRPSADAAKRKVSAAWVTLTTKEK